MDGYITYIEQTKLEDEWLDSYLDGYQYAHWRINIKKWSGPVIEETYFLEGVKNTLHDAIGLAIEVMAEFYPSDYLPIVEIVGTPPEELDTYDDCIVFFDGSDWYWKETLEEINFSNIGNCC